MTGQPPADFAGLLRALRKQARLTQEELAEESTLSLRTIQDLEGRRHRTAHKPTAQRLADALHLAEPVRALFVKAATGRAQAWEVLAADAAGPSAPTPVPRELPADVGAFTGRSSELAALDEFLSTVTERGEALGPVMISAVSGTAGAGKTALAVHWAHRVAAHFPDGQLYVNLRGFDPEQPASADEALAGFLGALGVAGPDIPPGQAARATRYRSLLTGRRMLVVLDNAASEEQVRPLLPGSPSVMALVTSRATLPGLVARDGAQRLDLDLLPAHDAVTLLRALIGDRVDADPAAAQALAEDCARLPLALRVAAELAAAHPGRPLAELAGELAGERDRLNLLDAGGDPRGAVASVLSWSYRHLAPDTARMFRLLGLHPGQDTGRHSAAALAATTLSQAGQLLGTLARAHLIEAAGPDRWGMHDLLRAYASSQAMALDRAETRQQALTRLFDYYLAACAAAMDCLAPSERHHRPDPPTVGTPVPAFTSRDDARSWLDDHLTTLVAVADHTATQGWPGHTIRLAQVLHRYFDGVHDSAGLTICRYALDAARDSGDLAAQARTLTSLGVIYGRQGHNDQATECHTEAIALARDAGDRVTQVWALGNLGLIHEQQGRYPQAARCNRQALSLYRELGDTSGEAIALTNLGLILLRQGRYQRAATHLRQAITGYREAGHRFGEAVALTNLGQVCCRQGRYAEATHHQEQALALSREIGSRRVEAWALARLAEITCKQGLHEQAVGGYQRALELFREVGDRDGEAEALNGAGENMLAASHCDRARRFHTTALTLTRRTGGKREEARSLNGLGEIAHQQGHHERAASYHTDALALARQTGDGYQQARAHHGLASAYLSARQHEPAQQHAQLALDLYTSLGVPEASAMRSLDSGAPPAASHP